MRISAPNSVNSSARKLSFILFGVLLFVANLLFVSCSKEVSEPGEYTSGDFKYITYANKTATIVEYSGNAETLDIPDSFGAYKVTRIGEYAFAFCDSLISITIPKSVTIIGDRAFYGCDALISIAIPESVTIIGNEAFGCCFSLISMTIPDSVTVIGDKVFRACKSLISVTIPESVTHIGNYAFADCQVLSSIAIPEAVTSIGANPFIGCDALKKIEVSPDNEYYTAIDGVLFEIKTNTLVCYPNAFATQIYSIPEGVLCIGDSAFYACSSLDSILIPESVTSIGDGAFKFCESLSSITIPESVVSIGTNPFSACDNLARIEISHDNENYDVIDDVLFETKTKTLVCYPNAFYATSYSVPEGILSIGDYAFSWCDSLTVITFPETLTDIGDSAFEYCDSLIRIIIPESVRSIGYNAFEGCDSLTIITEPGSYAEGYVYDWLSE